MKLETIFNKVKSILEDDAVLEVYIKKYMPALVQTFQQATSHVSF